MGWPLGWVDFFIFNKRQAEIPCAPCKSVENSKKYFLGQTTSIAEVMTLWGIHYIRVGNFCFLSMWAEWASKDAEFYIDPKI
jgi:hypothetical protein